MKFSTSDPLFVHHDRLANLGTRGPIQDRLQTVYSALHSRFDFVDAFAVSLLDAATDSLRLFAESKGPSSSSFPEELALTDHPTLRWAIKQSRSRLVNDLERFAHDHGEPCRNFLDRGVRAIYAAPLLRNDEFQGFLFFLSLQPEAFDAHALHLLDVYAHLITELVEEELLATRHLADVLGGSGIPGEPAE